MIYLDNHTATHPCAPALERMSSSSEVRYSSLYDLVGADEKDRFVFTSSGAEALNQVFWSIFLEKARKEGKTHILISAMEDAPTMQMAKRLEDLGCTIKIAPVNEGGEIDTDQLAQLINPRTALISVTMASGLTGVIQPTDEIIRIAKEKKVLLHLDATYAVGKYPLTFDSDYLTFSGDRIHSVKGSGALFAKPHAPLVPLILGGAEQGGLRGGSFDLPSCLALSAAAQQALLYLDSMALEIVRLRDLFESLVQGRVLYKERLRLPNTSAIAFENVHQEALLYYLERKGIHATIGGSYLPYLSRIDETALSFALSRMTTEEEIIRAAQIINETVAHLQTLSVHL